MLSKTQIHAGCGRVTVTTAGLKIKSNCNEKENAPCSKLRHMSYLYVANADSRPVIRADNRTSAQISRKV